MDKAHAFSSQTSANQHYQSASNKQQMTWWGQHSNHLEYLLPS